MLTILTSLALAGEWARQPIDPRVTTDYTAYTVGKGNFKLGLINQEYGLFENVDVGTSLGLLVPPLGILSIHGKVTGIRSERFDAAIEGGYLRYRLDVEAVDNARITAVPLDLTGSLILSRRWSVHGGPAWLFGSVAGDVPLDKVGVALVGLLGGSTVNEDMQAKLEDKVVAETENRGSLFANARVTLTRINFAADFRLNRRDSFIFSLVAPAGISGLVTAGYKTENEGMSAGATVQLERDLAEFGSIMALSYQAAWPHMHLKIGVPIALGSSPWYLGIPQAIDIFWMF